MSGHTPKRYSPENPPPLRRDGESVEGYRVRCGWDAPKTRAHHTPGPWEYDAESMQIIAPKCGYQWAKGAPVIAEVGRLDYDEPEANALLMAAAPDLLAALASVLSGAVHYQLHDNEQCVLDARAAIAKATGSTPA